LTDKFLVKKEEENVKLDKGGKSVDKVNNEILECALDFLNLLFGTGKESDIFWKEILDKQVQYDFGYSLKKFQKKEIVLGGLLHAVAHHCNLILKFDKSIAQELGATLNPFRRENIVGIKASSKAYSMQNLDVKLIGEKYKEAREAKKYELAIKSCTIALNVEKYSSYKGENGGDPSLLGDLAEIYFENGDLDQALEKAKKGLEQVNHILINFYSLVCTFPCRSRKVSLCADENLHDEK